MSEETVLKFKLATLVTIAMSILSIAVTVIGIWVGNISGLVSTHSTDIATLKECAKNQKELLTSIDAGVKSIQNDFNAHTRKDRRAE